MIITGHASTVIVLDDDPVVCERLRPALEKIDSCVETYHDSQEVMDLPREHSPSTKVITAFATADTARQAIKDGAVDLSARPFQIGELLDLISRITREEER